MSFPRPAVGGMAVRLDVFHLVAWIAILAVVVLDPAYLGQTTNLCAFRLVTGVDCPGCGLVRSWCATAHGHLGDAFALHLFGPATFAGLLVVLVAFRLTRATRPAGESFETWIARAWRGHLDGPESASAAARVSSGNPSPAPARSGGALDRPESASAAARVSSGNPSPAPARSGGAAVVRVVAFCGAVAWMGWAAMRMWGAA